MEISPKLLTDFFNTPALESDKYTEIGVSQWQCLNAVLSEYKGKSVAGTACVFEDDIWFSLDQSGLRVKSIKLIWSELFNSHQRALELIFRVAAFDLNETRRGQFDSLAAPMKSILNIMSAHLSGKRILHGEYNDVLIGPDALTNDDLNIITDRLVCIRNHYDASALLCTQLFKLLSMINAHSHGLPFCEFNWLPPWQKAGLSVKEWVQQRRSDLSLISVPVQGYEPIHHNSVMSILDVSLDIIENRSNDIKQLADLVRKNHKILIIDSMTLGNKQKSHGRLVKDHVKKRCQKMTDKEKKDLAKLYTLLVKSQPLIEKETFDELNQTPRTLLDLLAYKIAAQSVLVKAKAACLFIIFFTTGMRNIDVASLKQNSCKVSGRVDLLYYIPVTIQKTKNPIHIPVPERTKLAIDLAVKTKMTDSPYIFDWGFFLPADLKDWQINVASINRSMRRFADFFDIPFMKTTGEGQHSAHDIRVTVAGWMHSASKLSIILARRLFGHTNDVMPSIYLNNNPIFTQAMEEQSAEAAMVFASEMAKAAKGGRLAGKKGEQLEAGFKKFEDEHKATFDKTKSSSQFDIEILRDFSEILKDRILNGSMCGFVTPLAVACGRNPHNPEPSPCGTRSHMDKINEKDIDWSVVKNLTLMDPKHCIGSSCKEAIVGPWSRPILDTLEYYKGYLLGLYPQITDEQFKVHARQFVAQYTDPMKKVFGEEPIRMITEKTHDPEI